MNMKLSEKRAASVSEYLVSQNVASSRFTVTGLGETQPIVDNSTPENRKLNRRVEIVIIANADLVKAAENGELKVK